MRDVRIDVAGMIASEKYRVIQKLRANVPDEKVGSLVVSSRPDNPCFVGKDVTTGDIVFFWNHISSPVLDIVFVKKEDVLGTQLIKSLAPNGSDFVTEVNDAVQNKGVVNG